MRSFWLALALTLLAGSAAGASDWGPFAEADVVHVVTTGRKPLLIVGTLIQVISLTSVGFMAQGDGHRTLLLVSILTFVSAFANAMGPIPWIINAEIFPTKLRGRAMSVAIFALWLADWVVTQTFPMLMDGIGIARTFWVYAFCSLLSTIFVIVMIPETKGRTLEEIEASWRRHP